jgi:hypothetical protein
VAETSGLLNRRTGFTGTEGSNPSVSASQSLQVLKMQGFSWIAAQSLANSLTMLAIVAD